MKILFQKICTSKLECNDDIGILVNKWKEIVSSLTSSETVSFNCCFYPYDISDSIDKCYLHQFSEVSISAFPAVVYFKSVSRCGNVAIKFLTLKSRIVPLNKMYTILRLELLGCWIDSFISLSWIWGVNQEFILFVQNRVIKILENVNASLWRYCDTKENPADIITRFSLSNNSSENPGVKIRLGHRTWPNLFNTWSVLNFLNFKLCPVILRTKNWKLLSSFLGFKVIYQKSRNNKPNTCYY